MDKVYQILKSKAPLIHFILLSCAGFSAIITLERADYNLFLFAYVAYTMFWKSDGIKQSDNIIRLERMYFTIILTVSLLVDLIWIYTHSDICSSIIKFFSWIEFFIKIVVIGIVFVMWKGHANETKIPEIERTGFNEFEEEP